MLDPFQGDYWSTGDGWVLMTFLIIWSHLFRNANSLSVLCLHRVSQRMMLRERSSVRDWPKSFASFTRLKRSCIMNTSSRPRTGAENMLSLMWSAIRPYCLLWICLVYAKKQHNVKTSSVSLGKILPNLSGHGWKVIVFFFNALQTWLWEVFYDYDIKGIYCILCAFCTHRTKMQVLYIRTFLWVWWFIWSMQEIFSRYCGNGSNIQCFHYWFVLNLAGQRDVETPFTHQLVIHMIPPESKYLRLYWNEETSGL